MGSNPNLGFGTLIAANAIAERRSPEAMAESCAREILIVSR